MRRSGGLIRSTEVVTTRPEEQCSIALWRGYVKAQFYAREQGDDRALRVSPFFPIWHFPWEHSEPLDVDPRARAALAALRADLLADGWEPMPRAGEPIGMSFASDGTKTLRSSPTRTSTPEWAGRRAERRALQRDPARLEPYAREQPWRKCDWTPRRRCLRKHGCAAALHVLSHFLRRVDAARDHCSAPRANRSTGRTFRRKLRHRPAGVSEDARPGPQLAAVSRWSHTSGRCARA